MKRSLRYVLAAGLAVAALGSAAPAAQAAYCNPAFAVVCDAIALPCRTLGDNPKYGHIFCPPIG